MLKILTAMGFGLALCLAATTGWLFLELKRHSARAWLYARAEETLARDLEDARAKIARLEEELARESRRGEELAAGRAATPPAAEEAPSDGDEGEKKDPHPVETAAARSLQVRALSEAEGLAAEFVSRGDLEGLMLLAADLLGRGEEGYEKLIELSALLDKELKKGKESSIEKLWDHPEALLGPLFRVASQHDEDLLKFLAYVEKRPPDRELPEFARQMHRGLSEELAAPLVGFYDGSDPELLAELTGMYSRRLSVADNDSREARSAVMALGQIRTDESAQILLGALRGGAPASLQKTVVQSLAIQRNRQALPALRQLLEQTPEGELAETLRAAIRYLE